MRCCAAGKGNPGETEMKEERFFYVPDAATKGELPAEEAAHAMRVLRLRNGDEIFLTDGEGNFFRATVTCAGSRHCRYDIIETLPQRKAWRGRIHIAVAPTKTAGRMEWFAEKATEIGVDEISLIACRLSERRAMRTERMERIMAAAMKQSRKPWKPIINGMASFKAFITQERTGLRFIAHCHSDMERGDLFAMLSESGAEEDVTVMIGPEGDFSGDEVTEAEARGFTSVSLGGSRLRTETAALYAVMCAHMARRDMRQACVPNGL